MKSQNLAVLLLGLYLLSCGKPGEGPVENPVNPGVDSDYTVLLSKDGILSKFGFEANALEISADPEGNQVLAPVSEVPYYRQGNSFSFIRSMPGCNAGIEYWEPGAAVLSVENILPGDSNCERKVLAFAHLNKTAYITYSIPGTGIKEVLYYLRALSIENGTVVLEDVEMQKEPLQLLGWGEQLYMLTYDALSGKNEIVVLNAETGTHIRTGDLGTEVVKMLATVEGRILVSYEARHLLLDPATLEVLSRVQYLDGKEPGFAHSESYYFDPSGALYYAMPADPANSLAEHIPAIYDFSKYTAYLYFFENFLSEDLLAAYDIGDTRSVAFDHNNGLLLIGYEKAGAAGKGGLLRVKPVPEPKFIDQTDLDGIPLSLCIE